VIFICPRIKKLVSDSIFDEIIEGSEKMWGLLITTFWATTSPQLHTVCGTDISSLQNYKEQCIENTVSFQQIWRYQQQAF
jgi:hypothetical protein